jgi:hypothetical protein
MIDVFNTKQNGPRRLPREGPVDEKGPSIAKVQSASGRWRESGCSRLTGIVTGWCVHGCSGLLARELLAEQCRSGRLRLWWRQRASGGLLELSGLDLLEEPIQSIQRNVLYKIQAHAKANCAESTHGFIDFDYACRTENREVSLNAVLNRNLVTPQQCLSS